MAQILQPQRTWAGVAVLTLMAGLLFIAPAQAATSVVRLGGNDRYATAAAISDYAFDPGAPVAYVATGTNFPDALAGAAAAGYEGGPVLLVAPDSIPGATARELDRLRPGRIVVLGGTRAVSRDVETHLRRFTTGRVTRLAGADRFATAVAISSAVFRSGIPAVYVVTGESFPDALSAAPVAAFQGGPVLLVSRDTVPAATAQELDRLGPGAIHVVGGVGAISRHVEDRLRSFTSGPVKRTNGTDRFQTGVALSARAFEPGVSHVFLATGSNFPDALAGAAAVAQAPGPLLLTRSECIPVPIQEEIDRLGPLEIVLLGSERVVSTEVENGTVCGTTDSPSMGNNEIVLARCLASGRTILERFSPNGEIQSRKDVPRRWSTGIGSLSLRWSLCASFDGASLRQAAWQQFSSDGSLVGVVSERQPDGSTHVGYIDLERERFVDVTAATTSDGFGSTPPKDSQPQFAPDSQSFYFSRDGALHRYSLRTGALTPLDLWTFDESRCLGCFPGHFLVGKNDVVVPNSSGLLNPAGDLQIIPANRSAHYQLRTFGNRATRSGDSVVYSGSGDRACSGLQAWANDHTVLCAIPEHANFFLIEFPMFANGVAPPCDGDGTWDDPCEMSERVVSSSNLLPENTRQNAGGVVAPAGDAFAFLSLQGSTVTMWRMDLGAAQPTELAALGTVGQGDSMVLLDWKSENSYQ